MPMKTAIQQHEVLAELQQEWDDWLKGKRHANVKSSFYVDSYSTYPGKWMNDRPILELASIILTPVYLQTDPHLFAVRAYLDEEGTFKDASYNVADTMVVFNATYKDRLHFHSKTPEEKQHHVLAKEASLFIKFANLDRNHWIILVFSKTLGFFLYDSLGSGSNLTESYKKEFQIFAMQLELCYRIEVPSFTVQDFLDVHSDEEFRNARSVDKYGVPILGVYADDRSLIRRFDEMLQRK